MCQFLTLHGGLDKCPFVLPKSFIACFTPRGCFWCASIWLGTAPHYFITSFHPKGTFLQPTLFFLVHYFFPLGSFIWRLSVQHKAWMNVQRSFVSALQAARPVSDEIGKQLQSKHVVKLFENITSELSSVSFMAERKRSCIILIYDCLISFVVIWYDRECVTSAISHLCLPYSFLWNNRQFLFPISTQGKPLLWSNPVNA